MLRGAEVAASTLCDAAENDYRAAALLLKGNGLLAGSRSPRPEAKATAAGAFLESIVPDKRQAFEVQLRELIVSISKGTERSSDAPPDEAHAKKP